MDFFYYQKLMGNGSVASKFKFVTDTDEASATSVPELPPVSTPKLALESSQSHHPSNCARCYRLKKKCTRTYPKCSNCSRTGADCEYVERVLKRRKEEKIEKLQHTQPKNLPEPKSAEENEVHIVARKLVSISSLLADDTSKTPLVGTHTQKEREIAQILSNKTWFAQQASNLNEEFVTMNAVPDADLPLMFALLYFENYLWYCPFINKTTKLEEISKINFQTETIVNLDIYLLLSVGCVICDNNNGTENYKKYFNEKVVASIVNILQFNSYQVKESIAGVRVVILFAIFSICLCDFDLCWSVVGLLDRLMVQLDLYKSSVPEEQELFWSVYNIDKELSLLLNKPSQLPQDLFLPNTFTSTNKLAMQLVALSKLQNEILSAKLTVKNGDVAVAKQLLVDLEKWRIATTLAIHNQYADSPALRLFVGVTELNYYYLLTEIDQISSTESFQFALQFLSSSFSLLMTEPLNGQNKLSIKLSINNLMWFYKLFNVIKYNVNSLADIAESEADSNTITVKVFECNGNFQLMINMLRYLSRSQSKPKVFANDIERTMGVLESLSGSLIALTPESFELVKTAIKTAQKDLYE